MKICSKGFTFENCIYSPSDCGANCNEKTEVKMRNFDKIKNMSIDEMARYFVDLQLNVMCEIQQKLVYCLPLPKEEEIDKLYKETLIALESEE